jgi:chaperone modulatory protein CbpM
MVRPTPLLEAELLSESDWIATTEICRLCSLELPDVLELAELGVVAPLEKGADVRQLPATALPRLRIAGRLIRDLGVNVSGAALVLELLDAQRELERRIRALERLVGD